MFLLKCTLHWTYCFCRCESFCQNAGAHWWMECKCQTPEEKVFSYNLRRV